MSRAYKPTCGDSFRHAWHMLPSSRSRLVVISRCPGARWFKEKGLHGLTEALEVAEACLRICEWSGARWMLENPVSTLSSYWRKPNYVFDPCEYGGYLMPPGDAYTKKTCLWTGGGFTIPEKRPVRPAEGSKMHRLSPGPDRVEKRSETPIGFARAVFEANHSKKE